MNKICTFLLVMLLTITLCGCSTTPSTYTVEKGDTIFTVDTIESTISDGANTYQYTLSKMASGNHVEILYPDGSTYWWQTNRNGDATNGFGGWSDDYDENHYVNGYTLYEVLEDSIATKSSSKNIVVILLLIIIGILNVTSPYTAWYWEYGWRFKEAEPSDSALLLNRCAGVLCLIIALFMIFI